nr:histidine kinase [Pedobacter panaciterrae]
MKGKILLMLGWLLITISLTQDAIAQNRGSGFGNYFILHVGRSTSYYLVGDSTLSNGVISLEDYKKTNKQNVSSGKYEIGLFTKLNPTLTDFTGAPVPVGSKTYPSYTIDDKSDAILIALGITKDNIKNYKYHVVKDDSIEIVPWSPIPKLEQKYGATVPYGVIGTFNSLDGTIMVEVVNTKDYSIRDGVIYDWRPNFKPVIESIEANTATSFYELTDLKNNHGYSKQLDPITGLPTGIEFPADSIESVRLTFKHHETIPYTIYLEKLDGDSTGLTQLTYYLQKDYYIINSKLLKAPGKYRFKVVRVESIPGQYDKTQALYIPFEVKPPPPITNKKASLKQALPYMIATLSGVALLFFIYYRYNQSKLKISARERQLAGLKLKSIRSQLNPHFMFNALTSIQNLINKNNIEGANYYLSIFSGLTRQVLDTNNEEMLSIQEELKILDDYLQMEQLRFGFRYQITADANLNQANIDIPAMLLQPFVENAVKHGVSALKEEGDIGIQISKENNDIVISIVDNGKGFNIELDATGYGMKLSEERVTLLNQIYKNQSITLTVDSNTTGTTITIRLTNWIL